MLCLVNVQQSSLLICSNIQQMHRFLSIQSALLLHSALMKMLTIYGDALHERMSQYGLGMAEVNDFLTDVDETLTELLGEHIVNNLR